MRETRLALTLGGAAWLAFVAAYALALMVRARSDVPVALLYNTPIAFLFLVSLAYLVVQGARVGLTPMLRAHVVTIALWSAGLLLLYLRLALKTVEVSGHLAWLPMLTAQLWLWRFPGWVIGFGLLSTLVALYMKLAVFGGPSGVPGLLAGLVLATTLVALSRMHEHQAVER